MGLGRPRPTGMGDGRQKTMQSGRRGFMLPKGVQHGTPQAQDFYDSRVDISEYDQLCATPGPAATWLQENGVRPSAQFDYNHPPPLRTRRVEPVPNPHDPTRLSNMWPTHTCAKCHFGLRPPPPGGADPHPQEPYKYAHPQQDGGHPEGYCNAVKAEIWLSPHREVRRLLRKEDGTRPRDYDGAVQGVPPGLRP